MSGPSFLSTATSPRGVLRLGLLLVGAHLLLRAQGLLALGPSGADLGLLAGARDHALGSLLGTPVDGRLDPVTRAAAELVASGEPVSWTTAVALVLVAQALASLACLGALVACFGRRPAVLVLLGLHVTTATTWPAAATWSVALPQLLAQAATYAALGCWALHLRTGRRRWLAATVAACLLGALLAVEALLVPFVLLALAVGVHDEGGVPARLRRLVRRRGLALGLLVAVVVAGVVLHRAELTALGGAASPSAGGALALLRDLALGGWGGPWVFSPADPVVTTGVPTLVAGVAVVAGIALALLSRDARTGVRVPWLLLAAWVAASCGLLVLTGTSAAAVEQRGLGLPVAAAGVLVLLGHVALSPLGAVGGSRRRGAAPRLEVGQPLSVLVPPVLAVVALVAVLAGGLSSGRAYVAARAADPAVDYVRTAADDASTYAVVDLAATPLPTWFGGTRTPPGVSTATLLTLLTTNVREPDTASRLLVLAPDGEVVPAQVQGLGSWVGPESGCGWSVTDAPVRVPLENGARGRWLVISYLSGDDQQLRIDVGGRERVVDVRSGLQNLFVQVGDDDPVDADSVVIERTSSAGDDAVCVDSVRLGEAVPSGPLP
ncbi:hypothetical protein QE364_000545 [Nocardioides zeae]|uniref:Uncharacterized protein n=1 Tax=Nocardioides zeae TaxID=1457234 RepID=A0ACC6IE05_9ACTN|nr:hypothetical protein [Nocardioides zeae]MDR6175929.1 hypothetical protein [Nocardioides zeae]MDR6208857.1 hypothetical protein [Nocardioides zeae]